MKPNEDGLHVAHGTSGQGTGRVPGSRLQMIAAAVGLVVLLIGGATTLPQGNTDRANDAAAHPGSEVQILAEPTTVDFVPDAPERAADGAEGVAAQAGAAAFVYFPAQYENQAREKEEHIQAF